ncbi:MAG: TadE/TadG family type IV pilus assembly protein [Allorhizobium sp.]
MRPRSAAHILRDRSGAAAVEFALLVVPFLLLVFAILEVAFMVFINSTLDFALAKAARSVRTGTAYSENWNLARFKREVCANMSFSFDCNKTLLVSTTSLADFSTLSYVSPTPGGVLNVAEKFTAGAGGDYIMIQAFLPWNSLMRFTSTANYTLADGTYVLGAAALFRNEPF